MFLDRADRDDQPVGDRLIGMTLGDQAQDFQLALAERLDRELGDWRLRLSAELLSLCLYVCVLSVNSTGSASSIWPAYGCDLRSALCDLRQQRRHRRAFIHKDAHIAFRFGERQSAFEHGQRCGALALRLERQGRRTGSRSYRPCVHPLPRAVEPIQHLQRIGQERPGWCSRPCAICARASVR